MRRKSLYGASSNNTRGKPLSTLVASLGNPMPQLMQTTDHLRIDLHRIRAVATDHQLAILIKPGKLPMNAHHGVLLLLRIEHPELVAVLATW